MAGGAAEPLALWWEQTAGPNGRTLAAPLRKSRDVSGG